MILVDLNQIVLSNLMQCVKMASSKDGEVEEAILRHMILSSIRSIRNKFSDEYDEMVLCSDSTDYWRKEIFPHYKANRKNLRTNTDRDWKRLFKIADKLKEEFRDNLPYKFMVVPRCEADDIIAVMARSSSMEDPILIVSGDKDFLQLQKYMNVSQYSPVLKCFLVEPDPRGYLERKIIYGDSGDGIPNILSDSDSFVRLKRQKRITKKFVESFNIDSCGDQTIYENYARNCLVIDFDCIPTIQAESILREYARPIIGSSEKTHKYLLSNGLKSLLMNGEF